ncbi:hypothetical protein EVAR_77209_1 [Eumeta japonica]|uniref:Uncharacterized protein n=1 Tax=Eumeta variegata TaxID=151549 RepID=A0A4C1T2V4_EUMVA|nr:hypothetical protein EVAR_77209_1 [Eumeta japonica]
MKAIIHFRRVRRCEGEGSGVVGAGGAAAGGGAGGRAASLRLANGRVAAHSAEQLPHSPNDCASASVRISIDNTNTCCTDSLVTALDDETLLLGDITKDRLRLTLTMSVWASTRTISPRTVRVRGTVFSQSPSSGQTALTCRATTPQAGTGTQNESSK